MYELDKWEHSTVVAALIHYAGVVYNPDECIRALTTLVPETKDGRPWNELIAEYRSNLFALEQGRREAAANAEP